MKSVFVGILTTFIAATAPAQWFDKQSLACTILIEKWQDTMYVPHGTGFVLYNYDGSQRPIVVTAAHVLNRSDLYVSLNADSSLIRFAAKQRLDTLCFKNLKWVLLGQRLRARVYLSDSRPQTFVKDTVNDIGIFLIDLPTWFVAENGDTIKCAPFQLIPRSMIRYRKDLSLGDELYFVGFPFGFGAFETLEPVIRSGSLAWLSGKSNEFLLDAFSFGGNSGSPVFSKIILGRNPGYITWDDAYLVGIVVGHLGDSQQNWGPAKCVWIDQVMNLANRAGALTIRQ